MSLFSKGLAKGAFSGIIWCPVCATDPEYNPEKQAWKKDRYIHNTMIRLICKKCKTPIRYEFSNRNLSEAELVKLGLEG